MLIAGHRHGGWCRRKFHCGIRHPSVPYRSVPVPDWVTSFRHPDLLRHRHFCSFRYRTGRMPGSAAFRYLKHSMKVERDTSYTSIHGCCCGYNWKLQVNAGMPGKKLVRHRQFLTLANCLIPAMAFRHQGQSGTAGPAMLMLIYEFLLEPEIPLQKAVLWIRIRIRDPDPYWIRIQSDHWIRIRIRNLNTDPDPDPGWQKWPTKVEKIHVLKCWMASFVSWRFLL
jgi:hypothetical protein